MTISISSEVYIKVRTAHLIRAIENNYDSSTFHKFLFNNIHITHFDHRSSALYKNHVNLSKNMRENFKKDNVALWVSE